VAHENILLSADFQTFQTTCDWIVRLTAKVILRPTVSRRVRLGVKPYLGHKIKFLLLSSSFGFVDVERPLLREGGSVVYNCCWPSPAWSFSGASLSIYTQQEEDGIVMLPGTGFPFRPTSPRATLEVFEHVSTRE
jgi:hypothetical protein